MSDIRYRRRLSDDLIIAFHAACDHDEVEIARHLIGVLECSMRQPTTVPEGEQSRVRRSLVAAYERLWDMQHREVDDGALVAAITVHRAVKGAAVSQDPVDHGSVRFEERGHHADCDRRPRQTID
jgi:hypothetical protein